MGEAITSRNNTTQASLQMLKFLSSLFEAGLLIGMW